MTTYDKYSTERELVDNDVEVERTRAARRPLSDRVRWGAVWAGLVTAIAVFALLQLTFFATDVVSLDVNPDADEETTLPFWTGVAGGVAFLLGGLVTGASSRWRRISDGILQGVVMWAVATVGLLLVAGLAAGSLTSSLGGTFGELADLREQIADGATLSDAELDDARDAAASGVLLLGIMFGATVIGAVIGTKLWPRRRDTDIVTTDVVERYDERQPGPYDEAWRERRRAEDEASRPLSPPPPSTPPPSDRPETIQTEIR